MPVKKLSKKLPKKLPKNLPQKKKNRTRKQKGGNNAVSRIKEYHKNQAEQFATKKAQWAENLKKNDKYTKKMKYWIKKKEECYKENNVKNQEYYSELSAKPPYEYLFKHDPYQYKKYYGLFGKCKYFDTYIYKIKNYEYKIKANLPERKYIRKTDVNKIYNDLNNKPDDNKPLLTGFFKLYNELLENNNNKTIFDDKEIDKLKEKIAEVIVALRIIRNGGGTDAVINEIKKINLYNANKLNKKDFIIYLLKLAKNLLAK